MEKYPPQPDYTPEFTIEIPKHTLRFSSKFESGNLAKAIMISDHLYILLLENEANNSCLQWYYFLVNNHKPLTVTFQISNFGKYESLYNEGMQPLIRSLNSGNSWARGGTNISYTSNSDDSYTFSFSYTFPHANDTVYFAYSYPYPYSKLCRTLSFLKSSHKDIARVDSICDSLCGNHCYMVTITEDIENYFSFYEESYYTTISAAQRDLLSRRKKRKGCKDEHSEKQGIFVTGRVHPGETVGSFMMQGLLEFLVGSSREAAILRRRFVFKLVPMLNPDGVRYGKTRVSMLGVDLNRRWNQPNQVLHPTIYYTKKYLQVFKEMHKCLMFCDMHGHGTKRNVFVYGCNEKPTDLEQHKHNLLARLVPYMLSKVNGLVSYRDSRFRVQKSKESTARIVVYRQFGIASSLTIEASFYGPTSHEAFSGPRNDLHMLRRDLKSIGSDLGMICMNFINPRRFFRHLCGLSNEIRAAAGLRTRIKNEAKEVSRVGDSISYGNGNEHENENENENETEIPMESIDSKVMWNEVIVTELEYFSEESEESSPSDIEEYNKNEEIRENENEKKAEIIKPTRAVSTIKGIKRKKPLKTLKSCKNEAKCNPELFFKIGGITVLSFNSRTKSTENIFNKKSIGNLKPVKEKEKGIIRKYSLLNKLERTPEQKSSKLIICNTELLTVKGEVKSLDRFEGVKKSVSLNRIEGIEKREKLERQDRLIRMRPTAAPLMDKLYRAWMRSKQHLIIKPHDFKRPGTADIPTMPIIRINKAQIHSSPSRNP